MLKKITSTLGKYTFIVDYADVHNVYLDTIIKDNIELIKRGFKSNLSLEINAIIIDEFVKIFTFTSLRELFRFFNVLQTHKYVLNDL
jgi:hypothetical protein